MRTIFERKVSVLFCLVQGHEALFISPESMTRRVSQTGFTEIRIRRENQSGGISGDLEMLKVLRDKR